MDTEIKQLNDSIMVADLPNLDRVIIFGSIIYGEFVQKQSDLDVFVSFCTNDISSIIESLLLLKQISQRTIGIQNVDITCAKVSEISNSNCVINPFLYELISKGQIVRGKPLPNIFHKNAIVADCWNIAKRGLTELRSMVCRLRTPKPSMLFRSCDEVLFRTAKALLTILTRDICISRNQVVEIIQEKEIGDDDVFKEILDLRKLLSCMNDEETISRCESIVVRGMHVLDNMYSYVADAIIGGEQNNLSNLIFKEVSVPLYEKEP
ncbi:MAG: hypothetical protein FWD05_12830 [Oscillospiraceae bacterium]|nr:hypothetical protein [Oscillospiraceae bacterium]